MTVKHGQTVCIHCAKDSVLSFRKYHRMEKSLKKIGSVLKGQQIFVMDQLELLLFCYLY